jgi:hypothetical protein
MTKVEILLFGYSMNNDMSMITTGFAAMNYGGAFLFKFSARRSKLEDKIDNVPENLRRPFKIVFISTFVGVFCLIIGGIFSPAPVTY